MKFVGERRVLASAVFMLYFLFYGLAAYQDVIPQMTKALWGIAGVYGLAFWSLVAGYFWARWYAVGVGLFGVILAAVGMWQAGMVPQLVFLGGTHLAATLLLWGNGMAQPYDGQTAWREKFHMDDNSVQRLGRSVIRAGVSLPFVLIYALGPKPAGAMLASLAALALAGLGMRAVIQLRTWGVMALAASGMLLVSLASMDAFAGGLTMQVFKPAIAGVLLLAAAVPFIAPMLRWLRSDRRTA